MMESTAVTNKIKGCLYGQAIGDALGLGTEFMSKDEVLRHYPNGLSRYEDMIQDYHRRKWAKGAWTDDTDMMLCILDAFDGKEFNIRQVAKNFKGWADGNPVDIGSHTRNVLFMKDYVEVPVDYARLFWEISGCQCAANGAVMRTSVVGCEKNNVVSQAEQIAKLTHFDPRCVGSGVIVSEIIHYLIWENRQLSYDEIQEIGARYDNRIAEWIKKAYKGSIEDLDLENPYEMGYTLRTLGAGLWAYFHADDFDAGLLPIVNEGGDADTNGAVAAAILGAKYGYSAIPVYYIDNLHNKSEFDRKIDSFILKLTKKF